MGTKRPRRVGAVEGEGEAAPRRERGPPEEVVDEAGKEEGGKRREEEGVPLAWRCAGRAESVAEVVLV